MEESVVRVLVVEDEESIAAAVRTGLEAEDLHVTIADNGVDGLAAATEQSFDVIVLDIMLPRMNGYLVCRNLREAGNWTPILMLTAKEGEFDEAEALDTGADDYLTKPFSFVVLLARLRALIRRSGGSEGAARYVIGDLIVEPAQHTCTRDGSRVELTAKEFAVLEYLMKRAGEVATKTEILDDVWDFTFEGDANIVEVYVRHLRKKLDEPFGRNSLQTVRGVGYRLVDDRA